MISLSKKSSNSQLLLRNYILNFTELLIIAIVMIYMSVSSKIYPPGLTGLGFIIIAILFYKKKRRLF